MTHQEHATTAPARAGDRSRWSWIGVATAASLCVVVAEYLINALFNPTVEWSAVGVAAHLTLDVALLVPIGIAAVLAGLLLGRRLGFDPRESSGLLGAVGLVAIAFLVLALPLDSGRDLVHERFGLATGLSLAEVQTTVVGSDLTVQETTQLCSFGAVRSPSLARDGADAEALDLMRRVAGGLESAIIQLSVFLPLLLLGICVRQRRVLRGFDRRPALELARWSARRLRVPAVVAVAAAAVVFGGALTGADGVGEASPGLGAPAFDACVEGGPVKHYDVSAIDVTITLNRWGDHVNGAHMYALDANISDVRDFEVNLEADRMLPEDLSVTRVAHGLRKDPIQPLVLRANLGDCLEVSFTNSLTDGEPASMHILGLPHTVDNAGSFVGNNPDTMAGPGQTVTYRIPVPLDVNAERAYYFHDHGAGRRRQNMGLFGAIVVEPEGSTYLDPETGETLNTATGSNWEAIIVDPNLDGSDDGKSFREFVIFYHEIGNEGFTDLRDRDDKKLPLVDELAGVYRPGARALNYRSEPFRNRIAQDDTTNGDAHGHGKSLGYASYPFGDPATPTPRSYVGEATKTRLLHGGSEVFHVHHLHGGGDRWRRNPNADPNSNFWKGLTKVPNPDLTSIHLDSQSIGPGTSYNLEHECGAGGCQQGVGDFLYHCHIGHHYLSGMWSFWRVFGTEQTEQTNQHGHPLAVIPDLYQADNVFSDDEAPSNTPPMAAVSAGDLIGLTVDDGKMIVADADVVDPLTQVGVLAWVVKQLPPSGVRLDNGDATVWDWAVTGDGATLQVWGEPDSDQPFPGWVSPMPGVRPEVLFNPKNARYVWPLFRPQVAARPPFSARHSGAPWLGEDMKVGRYDGLCARTGVHPNVDVGERTDRYYPVSSITLPIQVTKDRTDPDGMIFVLNEHEADIRAGLRRAEPLAIRSNVGDCVEIVFTNKIPDGPLNKEFSKTNIHSHFVQFDTQASDGVITGMSYEQSVRPIASEGRTLNINTLPGATELKVSNVDRLRVGIWVGIGLGTGTCGTSADGQPLPCTEVRQIAALPDSQTIVLDNPTRNPHRAGEAVGVEFVRYLWYPDVDFGTVFFHTHVNFNDWDHGLFGAHIVEPKGSTYHSPRTGEALRAGTLVDVRVDPNAGGSPVASDIDGSFREFMLFLHNNNPVEGPFSQGGATINLRAEPWRLRDGEGLDPAYRFSSVLHGAPHTQTIGAYVGDPVVIRGMGLVERVGGIRFTGHRFHQERTTDLSDVRDATFIGISERFDVSLDGGAGGPGGYTGDYLYYSTLGKDFESGAWGILRVIGNQNSRLQPLPDQPLPPGGDSFPELRFTGTPPPSLEDGPGDACPQGAPVREYDISLTNASIVYNDFLIPDIAGVAYQPSDAVDDEVRSPVVMRANAGECLRVNLTNEGSKRGSLSVGELVADPQRSYGTAVGLNYDSSVAPGATRTYEYFADEALGLVLGLNLSDVSSVKRGAFAGVVIEPEGSTYTRPGSMDPLPQGGLGIQADVYIGGPGGVRNREFVALFNDEDRLIGQSAMPYPVAVERFAGINYSHEPLSLRNMTLDPSRVFDSATWGDPRNVVSVPAGTPMMYRVGQPWGNQVHVPTLEGHRYRLEPFLPGSEEVYNDVLAPGMAINMRFVGGAGGDIGAPGDYLFLDRRQPFMEWGLWNILRVTAEEQVATDSVRILDVRSFTDGGADWLQVEGILGVRPAGDTARAVAVFAGRDEAGRCDGPLVGRAQVDPGSGRFVFRKPVGQLPSGGVCVVSAGGGQASAEF